MSDNVEMLALTTKDFFAYLSRAYIKGIEHGSDKVLDYVFYGLQIDTDKFMKEYEKDFKYLFNEFIKNEVVGNKKEYE